MAFCKYCGTQLAEGQECGCEKAVASRTPVETPVAPVEQPVYQQAPVQQPVYQQAPVQQPVYQQAPVQQPVYQQAPVQQPVYQQTPVQQPVYQQAPMQGQPVYQQTPMQGQPMYQQAPYPYPQVPKGPNVLQLTWAGFIGMWKKPVEGSVNFVKTGTMATAFILMGLQALLSGFLALAQLGKIEASIKDAMGPMLSWAGEKLDLGLPYGKMFLICLLLSLVVSGLYIGAYFAGIKIFKGTETIKEAINVTAIRCMAAIPFTLLAIVFTLFNQFIPLAINALALGVSLIFMLQGAKAFESIEENKRTYMMAIVKTAVLIVALIIVYLVVKGSIDDLFSEIGGFMEYIM